MSNLLWPGDHRAGDLFSDTAVLAAMVEVEQAWLDGLVATGIAPASAAARLPGVPDSVAALAEAGDAGGNPVIPLVALLRERSAPDVARWVHRGLTSQDVLDTALVLCARQALGVVRGELGRQVDVLAGLAEQHRDTVMVARTLTRPAVPTTFGLKAATWLTGLLDALDDVTALTFPVQLGGAAGTLAGAHELARALPEPASGVASLVDGVVARLGLEVAAPWHTTRSGVTRIGDAATRCTDGWGRIARDVLLLTRPEFGELSLGVSGGSSTLPHKQNPTLAVLVRRAALAAPALSATLHLAAADMVDERADGAWHVEWDTLRMLLRRTVVAGSQVTELVGGLAVHPDRMAAAIEASRDDLLAERRNLGGLIGVAGNDDAAEYLGSAGSLVDAVLERARSLRA